MAAAGSKLGLADANRATVGAKAPQGLLGHTTPDGVGRLQNGPVHLHQATTQAHHHFNRHVVTRTFDHLRHIRHPTLF